MIGCFPAILLAEKIFILPDLDKIILKTSKYDESLKVKKDHILNQGILS